MLRALLIVAILGSASGAGGGTLAAHLKTANPNASAMSVQIALAKPGKRNTLSLPASGLAAGDRVQRPFDLRNRSSAPISAIVLTTVATQSSPLDTDTVNGLQLRVDRCSGRWRYNEALRQYGCKKTITAVVLPRAVIGKVTLAGVGDIQLKKRKAHLLLTLSLPDSAGNALQGRSSTLTYTFTAVQGLK